MNEREIFANALQKEAEAERSAYLDEACAGDAQMRRSVEGLLLEQEGLGSFLDHPIVGERPTGAVNALTDREGAPDPAPKEVSLDFLEPCDATGRLGMLGPYEVIEMIGRGGMGVVLRAHDPKLNRVVAIKVLAPEFAANPTARKRFLREAQAAAAVSHPHVVSIHAVDQCERTPYLVMECIDGPSLREKIEGAGYLKREEILRIGSQIAAGLAAAHRQGLIHRDVKPGNILLENGVERVKITDFGLARAVDDVSITRTGDVAGTPLFMSPEQAQGKPLDHRSDLFSLGCVLYAMCTGRAPFRAETTVAVLRRVCDDTPRPIREVTPEIPESLVAIVDRLLAKDPDERFQTAQEVADVLGRHLAWLQHPTSTPPPGPVGVAEGTLAQARTGVPDSGVDDAPAPRRSPSRRRFWATAALVLLVLVGSLGVTEATGVTRLAATVIRIAAGEGTLVIEVDDPNVQVSIDGEDVSISGAGVEELRLRPGKYRFRAVKGGKPIKTQLVTISRGGRVAVRVTMESPARQPGTSTAAKPEEPPGPGAPVLLPEPHGDVSTPGLTCDEDGWIALAPLVRADHDLQDAGWKWDGHSAAFSSGKPRAKVSIPVRIAGSYELQTRVTITRAKETTAICLPISGTRAVVVDMKGDRGNTASPTATIRLRGLKPEPEPRGNPSMDIGTEYALSCKVLAEGSKVTIEVRRDGRVFFQWAGDVAQVAERSQMRPGMIFAR